MTAISVSAPLDQVAMGHPTKLQAPVKAAKKLCMGQMVALIAASGYADDPGASTGGVVGIAEADADNTAVGAADGDVNVNVLQGMFWRPADGTNPPTIANVGKRVYAKDNYAISTSPADGPVAGICCGVDTVLGVLVFIGSDASTLDEIYAAMLTAQKTIPIDLTSSIDIATGAVLAVFAGGASTTPGTQLTDSKTAAVRWNNDAAPGAIAVNVPKPQDLDDTKDVVFHALVSKTGATLADATKLTVGAFEVQPGALHDADANFGGDSDAVVGDAAAKTVTELTLVLAAANVSAAPGAFNLQIKPKAGTLGTDDLLLHAAWLEYTPKLLTT